MKEKLKVKNKLKKIRLKNEVSQFDLALEIRINPQVISNIETGKCNCTIKTALLIAKYFSLKVDDIFELSNDNN